MHISTSIAANTKRGHGSPYDRGDSDAYYGRRPHPHKWTFERARPGTRFPPTEVTELTPEEVREYFAGLNDNPSGAKDWE